MYSKTTFMGDDYVYNGCDLVTVNINDDPNYIAKLASGETFDKFTWSIGQGGYMSNTLYDQPCVVTVEVVSGTGEINTESCTIEYLNGAINHFTTSQRSPVIAYTVAQSATHSHIIVPAGELIVTDRPSFLSLRLLETQEDPLLITKIVQLSLTFKYSYYIKKPSRIGD
jgi:hypothetical protein